MGTLLASANEKGRSPQAAQVLKLLKNTRCLWISSSSCTQNNHIQIKMAHIDDRDLVELAGVVQKADQFTRATAGSKLTVIAEQVRFLQEQARKVLEDARLNALLHKTACNFKKVPGKTYYVYKQRANPDEEMLSMISPEEWGAGGPEFVGGYRLEFDMSWTELKDLERRGNEIQMINKILDTSQAVSFNFLPSQYQAGLALEDSKHKEHTEVLQDAVWK